ncbi:DNA replication origin-binding helicase UL9 [Leporid alphaherpesvirus 4]|uniref:Replication origin-binding protein n=1 Tax=Leporid alphaherpesvirus 4 TaxID=481315 RepID=J9QVC3_9ALPH|nr:DNA replication origin-binding helicase UL9 [Leporid alphaherpesvirus 4]AFR32450.1 DNA replication origin-binding helicase UL9 [Leporid alphaherpesvirus 4]
MHHQLGNPPDADRERYASSVSLARMLYGGDLAEWVSRSRSGATLERQRDGPVAFPDASDPTSRCVTVVRAPMGSGKTTALIRWLREAMAAKDTSVLVISCRRSFTQTLATRFAASGLSDFVTYLSSSHYIMNDRPFHRLIVQVESLHRVGPNLLDNYDVLVMDEVMSTIGQLYSPTMQQLCRVDCLLMRLLRACPRIIAMDATANAQLVDFLCGLRGEKNVHVVVSEYAMPGFSERECTFLPCLGYRVLIDAVDPAASGKPTAECADATTFFGELRRRLEGGQNVCIFSSTVSFSEIAARFCARFTDRVLLLNSTTPHSDVETWGSYRAVVYTTVVTVGLSFDVPYFDSMFAYVKPMNYGPDMVSVYQSLGRVRILCRRELLVYVDGSGARSEPVFTPMLLNHVVEQHGLWPAQFSQVTGALCHRFKLRCDSSGVRGSRLYSKFRYKHYFERCTLACMSDSLNILHMLLDLNRMRVVFRGQDIPLTANGFCGFVREAHSDALRAQRALRELRARGNVLSLEAQAMDTEEVGLFAEKYLRPDVTIEAVVSLMRAIGDPVTRGRFLNLVLLEACLRVPVALQSSAVFRRLYDHYVSGVLPVITPAGELELVPIRQNPSMPRLWFLFRTCGSMAEQLGWDSACGGTRADFGDGDVMAMLFPSYRECVQTIFELGYCNITDADLSSETAVANVAARLGGKRHRGALSERDHAMHVFRLIWTELFGVYATKSTQTFPGAGRVKNLTKSAIIQLLDARGIDRSGCSTHRQLYARLMSHKSDFVGVRFKLRAPAWGRILKTLSTCAPNSVDTILEMALAELPTEAWPRTQGAVDFNTI